jgi:hypothetical protein
MNRDMHIHNLERDLVVATISIHNKGFIIIISCIEVAIEMAIENELSLNIM